MVINFDSTRAAAASPSGRLDRHNAEARQDRWMLEVERGMLSAGAKKELGVDHASGAPAQSAPRSPAVPIFMRVAPKADTPVAESAPVRQDARFAPARRASDASAALQDAGVARRATDASTAPQDATVALRPTQGSRWHEAHTRRPLIETSAPVGVGVLTRQPVAIPHGPQLPAAATAQVYAGLPAPGIVLAPGQEGSLLLKASLPLDITALPTRPQAPESAEPPVPSAEAAEAAGAEAPAPSGEPVTFDKRLMHVFVMPDGVHAFIRDAELNAAQMRSVALMLSDELAVAGQSLAALTVNGRAVEARVAAFDDIVSLPNNEHDVQPAASKRPPHSLTCVRKGNPQ